jgi:sorbitol/mannitol transport system substrate-binding protein
MWSTGNSRGKAPRVTAAALAVTMAATTVIAGSALAQDERTLNVAMVANGQMEDIAMLTPELFTAESGINIEYTILDEATLREVTTRDVGAGGEQFDVVMVGMFEAPQFGRNGWLVNLSEYADADADYDVDDIFPTVRNGLSYEGNMYAAPFYAESSFLMYRDDVLEAAGITMPDAPTWDEVAEIARTIDTDEMAGICLRGKPSWGDLGAIFTTVVNTFGATYWLDGEDSTIGESQVDQPEFKEAVEFYVGLIEDAGEDDAANSSYNECTSQLQAGKAAMWVDATVAASNLEGDDSPIKGKLGYALSPTKVTDTSGWLWSWALAIPETAPDKDAAWDYVSWATGPQYLAEAGDLLPGGWAALPPGTRQSLYANPAYQEAAAAFADRTLAAMQAAPIDNPGVQPRPGLPGVQFVGVPQFQDFGTRCMQEISAAIAGSQSTDDAIAACDAIATEFEGQRW